MSFVQRDKVYRKYYDDIIILLGTGLRISELCGLTDADIDLENRIIDVNHQLLYCTGTGYYIDEPKQRVVSGELRWQRKSIKLLDV